MKYFKSEITNRIIEFIDQCFYCKQGKSCGLAMPGYTFKCPNFDEDPDLIVAGPGINVEKENKQC